MTYNLFAIENTKARLCAKQASISCKATAETVKQIWEAEGFDVRMTKEG